MASSAADFKYPAPLRPMELKQSAPLNPFVPYFPHIVDPAQLMDNWKLLTDEQIKQVQKDLKDEPLGRHSKDKCKLPYGIIKGTQGHYAIYRTPQAQVELGEGRHGQTSIKVVQHLETGEWFLLKTSKAHDLKAALTEIDTLVKLGRSSERQVFGRKSKKTGAIKYEYLMKLEKGFDLSHILNGGGKNFLNRMPQLLRLYILKWTNQAYKELRVRGYIHRDIKPGNVMVSLEDGTAKFIDLEYARVVDAKAAPEISSPKGTLGYIAPEVLRGEFSERGDVYALGVIYRALLLNEFTEGSLEALHAALPKFTQDGSDTYFSRNDALVRFIYGMHYRAMPSIRPTFAKVEEFFDTCFNEYCKTRSDEVMLISQYQEELRVAEQERLNMLGDLWLRLPLHRVDAFWNHLDEGQLKGAALVLLEKQKNIPELIGYFIQLKARNKPLYQKIVKGFSAHINKNDLKEMQSVRFREFGNDLIAELLNADRARIFNNASINDFASLFYRENLPLAVMKQLLHIMQPGRDSLALFINGLFEYQANAKAEIAKQNNVPFVYPYKKRMEDALAFINKYFGQDKDLHIKAILYVNKGYQEYIKKLMASSCCGGFSLFGRSASAKLKASVDLMNLAEKKPDGVKRYYETESIARKGKLNLIAASLEKAIESPALFQDFKHAGLRSGIK